MSCEVCVDGRGLEPPEPMERVLLALQGLQAGEQLRFLIHREPFPLYPILVDRGFHYQVSAGGEGGFVILIRRASDDPHGQSAAPSPVFGPA